jgi:hypothetical protein
VIALFADRIGSSNGFLRAEADTKCTTLTVFFIHYDSSHHQLNSFSLVTASFA